MTSAKTLDTISGWRDLELSSPRPLSMSTSQIGSVLPGSGDCACIGIPNRGALKGGGACDCSDDDSNSMMASYFGGPAVGRFSCSYSCLQSGAGIDLLSLCCE